MDSDAPQLTLADIKRWHRRFRHDHEFRNEHGSFTVPISCFCLYAGVSRQNLYGMLQGRTPLTAGARTRLSAAIYDIQRGLRFVRVNGRYQMLGPFRPLPKWQRPPLNRDHRPMKKQIAELLRELD